MTLSYTSGSFTSPADPGNQVITGTGFTPSVVIFFGYGKGTVPAVTPDASQFTGAASGPTSRWATSRFGKNGARSGVDYIVSRANTSTKCISYWEAAGVVLEADLVSLDADGFTLNWTTTRFSKIFYLAIGGISAKCGTFPTGTVVGNKVVTGVGFLPAGILLKGSDSLVSSIGVAAVHDDMGAATSSTERWHTNNYELPGVPLTLPQVYYGSDRCYSSWGNADIHYDAAFVSMNADGFTINCLHTNAVNQNINYIALAGLNIKVGSFKSGATSADVVVSGLGFKPGALIITSMDFVDTSSISDENVQVPPTQRSLGMGTGPSSRRWAMYKVQPGGESTDSDDHCNAGEDAIMASSDNNGNVIQLLDLKRMDNDGFTLRVVTTDNLTRRGYYMALGSPVRRRTGHMLPCSGVG